MSDTLAIRPITQQDYASWLPIWEGYNAFYGRSGPTALADEVTRTTWSRFLDPDEPMHALVAERDGRLLGLTHYLFHRSTIAIGFNCYLQDLFTTKEARGEGIGRALILAVHERAVAAQAARVYWMTHETNAAAMKLYDQVAKRTGFVHYLLPT